MPDILTTHVGSLPRGNELVPLLLARDHGKPYDAAAFERLVQAGVEDAVEERDVRGVDAAFERLEVVAVLPELGDEPLRLRHEGPFEIG